MWVQCMENLDRFGPKQADWSLVNWGSVGFKKWEDRRQDQWFEVIEHQWAHLVQGLILRKTRGTKPNDLDQDQPGGQLSNNGFKKWHKGSRKKRSFYGQTDRKQMWKFWSNFPLYEIVK